MAFLTRIAICMLSIVIASVHALATLHATGAKIFDSNGNQFFIKGVAYQLIPSDPLLNLAQCTLDATLMSTLGVNTIRVYHVDPLQSHDDCMAVFAQYGIYVWVDLDTFATQMDEQNRATWTVDQYSHFAAVMDAFAGYENLAGVWVGNEVLRSAGGSNAAVLVKAATNDLKAYRKMKGYRDFMIGYSAADIASLRPMLQNYLACGNSDSTIEAFGLNSYEWCGPTNTFEGSGYAGLQAEAEGYSIPIFFSETGCNVGTQNGRLFEDQAAILGPDMDGTWSGAIIYEWIQEVNNYGLVTYPGGGVSGAPTPLQPDFNNLKSQWQNAKPVGVIEADYKPSFAAPACPAATDGWLVNGDPALPTLGVGAVTKVTASATPTPAPAPAPVAETSVTPTPTPTPSPSPSPTPDPTRLADHSSSSSLSSIESSSSSSSSRLGSGITSGSQPLISVDGGSNTVSTTMTTAVTTGTDTAAGATTGASGTGSAAPAATSKNSAAGSHAGMEGWQQRVGLVVGMGVVGILGGI